MRTIRDKALFVSILGLTICAPFSIWAACEHKKAKEGPCPVGTQHDCPNEAGEGKTCGDYDRVYILTGAFFCGKNTGQNTNCEDGGPLAECYYQYTCETLEDDTCAADLDTQVIHKIGTKETVGCS